MVGMKPPRLLVASGVWGIVLLGSKLLVEIYDFAVFRRCYHPSETKAFFLVSSELGALFQIVKQCVGYLDSVLVENLLVVQFVEDGAVIYECL